MATTLDLIVIAVYLLITLVIGVYASKREHLEGYLINNRKTKLLLLTLSNVATQIGAGSIVGVASAAYTTGISYGLVVLISQVVGVILFAYFAVKVKTFGDKHNAYTVGDFFEYRFGKASRTIFASFYIILAFIWGAVQFVAIAQLLKILTGMSFTIALVASAGITILYTSLAGLISDIWTDFFQFWVMLATFLVLIPLAFSKAGGMSALTQLPHSYFDPVSFGGYTFLIGGIILSGLIVIPEVHFWQRIYSAESVKTAKRSFLWAVPGIVFFSVSAIVVGLLAVKLVPGVEADSSIFALMNTVLPSGLLGLGYAGIIAVVMSSIDSILLGGSATILKDLYMPFFHPKMHEHELLNMARYITAIFGILSAGIAFFAQGIVQLTIFAAFTAGCFVFAILGGLFWKRTTAKASIASMVSSLIVLFVTYPFLDKVAWVPTFGVAILALIVVSFFTKHSKSEHVTI